MGVHLTSESKVAMFDSVTDMAFGPVFDSADEAEAFIEFVREKTGNDVRTIGANLLEGLRAEFLDRKEQ